MKIDNIFDCALLNEPQLREFKDIVVLLIFILI
jgi:hypothetical protein